MYWFVDNKPTLYESDLCYDEILKYAQEWENESLGTGHVFFAKDKERLGARRCTY